MDDNKWYRDGLGLEFDDKNIKRLENFFKRRGIEQCDWRIYTDYLEENMSNIGILDFLGYVPWGKVLDVWETKLNNLSENGLKVLDVWEKTFKKKLIKDQSITRLVKPEKIDKIKKSVLYLGTKFARLQIAEISEECAIEDDQLIIYIVKEMIDNKEIYAQYFSSTKSIAFEQQANIADMDKLKEVISPVILPEQLKICVVCRGSIQQLFYECSGCSAMYHLECASRLKDVGKGCFQCYMDFPSLPDIKGVEGLEEKERDPVIISIETLSKQIGDLLSPVELLHKDLTAKFDQIKNNLQNELKHKISRNFYEVFREQINEMFEKIKEVDAENKEEIDAVKIEQNSMFTEILKEIKNSYTLDVKNYAHNVVQQFFEKPSEKNIERLRNLITSHIKDWTEENKKAFSDELTMILDNWKQTHPKWKEWVKKILRVIPIIINQ